jgi:hypothetical protein
MNNEVPDTPQAAAPDAKPRPPADMLRTLLDAPKPKDESWQADAGRVVSMLAVGFLNESDDGAALRSVALLGLAQSLGVKEARKRAIKLSRWAESAPPPLTTLALKDEQQAALVALVKLTTGWSRRYVEQALADLSLPEEFVPDLLKWGRGMCGDTLIFIRDFYAPQIAAGKSADRVAALLKDAAKLLKPSGPEPAVRLAEGAAALVNAFLQSAKPGAADDKTLASSVAVLLHLMQDQAATAPAVLLQPAFVMAVGRLGAVTSKGAASKQLAMVSDALSLATISLLTADVERYGTQATNHWKAMVPTWRSAYLSWDACIASASKLSPALAAITAERSEDAQLTSDVYDAEAVFARLLPAWDAFVAELPDSSRAASLSMMLQQAAATLGIAPLGEKGAVVNYDPLSHHLAAEVSDSPRHVRILRPGVQVQRADGSSRVLVAALVSAA